MTDANPLAGIEALLDWPVGRPTNGVARLIPGDDLRAALTEAREAVDALAAERDAAKDKAARFAQLLAGAAKESNAAMSKLAQRIGATEAERDAAREALARVEALQVHWETALGEVTVTEEWAVRHRDGWTTEPDTEEAMARAFAAHAPAADAVVKRTVTTTTHVTDWTEVEA